MKSLAPSPVQDVSFGTALNISLNNYYDLLKAQVGGLGANEFLQLKLVADPVDISDDDVSKKGYRWWSYYNLLQRSDLAISPGPLADQVQVSAIKLVDVYSDFLDLLIRYVAYVNLTPQDQKELADIQVTLKSLRDDNDKLDEDDQMRWQKYADRHKYAYGDQGHYAAWESDNGNSSEIKNNNDNIKTNLLRRKIILAKQYPDPEDKQIVDASAAFDSLVIQMGYPIHADYLYSDGAQFSVNYLSTFAGSSTSLFDSRRVITWNQTLGYILTTSAGKFKATFDKATAKSTSITTDWGASGSVGYDFVSVSASTSEHTQIQEDFKKGTAIALAAEAAFRVNIVYPSWFRPTLFACKHVKDNPADFVDFFGAKGSLLYYPTALILVRGFSVDFLSTQDWTYDYAHSFSASAGGGFNAFGIDFGASGNYSENTKEHDVDQSKTSLTFGDDKNTIRFVGYTVAKNTVYIKFVEDARKSALGEKAFDALYR